MDNSVSDLNETGNKLCDITFRQSIENDTNKINNAQCVLCNKLFHAEENLVKHYEDHSLKIVNDDFACTVCLQVFHDIAAILEHYNRCHISVKFIKCSACNRKFADVQHLRNHIRNHRGYEAFTCGHCNENFFTKYKLNKHSCQKPPDQSKLHVCGICLKRYATKQLLRQHQKEYQILPSRRCNGCKRQLDENLDADQIFRHKLHCKKRQLKYTCGMCFQKFSCISQRLCHIKNVHSSSYKC